MNNRLTDFNTLGSVYLNRVLIKEDSSGSDDDKKLKEILNQLKQNSSKLREKILELQNLFYNEMFNEDFLKQLKNNPQELTRLTPKNLESVTESYNLEEGIGSRLKSNVSGWKRFAYGERTGKGENNIQSHRVNKRFEIFRDKVGSHLRELERDLETTSGADESIKNEIKQMISNLSSEEYGNIEAKQSKLGDIRHKIGRGVEFGAKALTLGGIGALLGGGIASIVGAAGIPAVIIKGAVAGAVRKAASDLINGKAPKPKDVALQAAIFAAAAPLLQVSAEYIMDNFDDIKSALGFGSSSGSTEVYAGVDDADVLPATTELSLKPEDYFKDYHGSSFDPSSDLDKAKVAFDNALFDKNLKGLEEWSDGPSPAIVNAASEAGLDESQYQKITQSLNDLTDKNIEAVKKRFETNPDLYAKAFIKYLLQK